MIGAIGGLLLAAVGGIMITIYLTAVMSCTVVVVAAFWGCAHYARRDIERLCALEKWLDQQIKDSHSP